METFYYHSALLAAAMAHLRRVATGHFRNGIAPGYSMAYRVFIRFETTQIVPGQNVLVSDRAWA